MSSDLYYDIPCFIELWFWTADNLHWLTSYNEFLSQSQEENPHARRLSQRAALLRSKMKLSIYRLWYIPFQKLIPEPCVLLTPIPNPI